MKRILQLLCFLVIGTTAFGQSQRTLLVEEFTQASCPPCETTTPALNAILDKNSARVVQIRYQTSWPGVDPMNADNPGEVADRVSYYGVTGVPDVRADGVFTGNGVITQAEIDNRAAVDAPVAMEMTHELDATLENVTVTLTVTNEGSADFDPSGHKLRVAVVEEEINWPYTPGSTSIVDFEYVMKAFLTGTAGQDMATIPAGMSEEYTWTAPVPNTVYNYNKLLAVAFIQNDSSQEVVQATDSEVIELSGYPDLSIAENGTVGDGLCDLTYAPGVTVTNESDVEVNDMTVNFLVNGAVVGSQTSTDALAAGASVDIQLDEIQLSPGTSVVSYNVVSNGAVDIVRLNNLTQNVGIVKAGAGSEELSKTFEDVEPGFQPLDLIMEVPLPIFLVNSEILGSTDPLGGFGESDVSVRVNYWNWDPSATVPTGFMAVADQLTVTDQVATLDFDYAFTTWGGSNDRMDVQISTDCGATYTDVWGDEGSTLATAPEFNQNNATFLPTADQWKKVSIDIGDYIGETILVRFFFTSGWGDMMYIDNIQARGVSNSKDEILENNIEIAPNPASDVAFINLNIEATSDVTVTLRSVVGEVISQDTYTNQSGDVTLEVAKNNLAAGQYFASIAIGEKVITKRISFID